MKFIAGLVIGAVAGAVLTYGLLPFPRVIWDGQAGMLVNGTFNCVGIEARNGAHLTVTGTITWNKGNWCQGFLRRDYAEGADATSQITPPDLKAIENSHL
jgi:hypothetical protein